MKKEKILPEAYFANYLCHEANWMGRLAFHDELGIKELPWMKDEFAAWLQNGGKSAETVKDTVSRMKSIDRYVFDNYADTDDSDEALQLEYFFINLKLAFLEGNREEIERQLMDGERWTRKFRDVAKEYDIGDDAVRNWLTVFGHYRRFIVERFAKMVEDKIVGKPTAMNLSAEDLRELKVGATAAEGAVVKSRLQNLPEDLTASIHLVSSFHSDLRPHGLALQFDFDKSVGVAQVNEIMQQVPAFEDFPRFIWGADFVEEKQTDNITVKMILTYGE